MESGERLPRSRRKHTRRADRQSFRWRQSQSPATEKCGEFVSRRAPIDISTAMSRALSVTVMESTTRTLSPATKVISPMKIAVTSFSSRSARNRARFSSTQVLAANPGPASRSSTRAISVGAVGLVDAEFENIDNVAGSGKRLGGRQRHKAPVFVIVIEAGIEYARDAEAACSRHHAEGREPALRTGKCHIIAGR